MNLAKISSTTRIKSQDVTRIRKYIDKTWDKLTRCYADSLVIAKDNITQQSREAPPTIYIPKSDDFDKAYNNIKQYLSPKDFKKLRIEPLTPYHCITDPGALLYLPHPYIVPGGRFNEMYGWDSYFIIHGLLTDDRVEMAKNMADNLLYEIKHYGKMLNSNRCYSLSRSQPPIISEAILAIYFRTQDKKWLKNSLPELEKFYNYWTTGPRLIKGLGLSRYYADSNAPLPDAELGYHERVRRFYDKYKVSCYDIKKFYDAKKNELKPAFYRADRSVRESGFDLSNKFGPFGADICSYAPISLNSLLCQMEQNLAEIYRIFRNKSKVDFWTKKYKDRIKIINDNLWEPDLNYYFDYNFRTKANRLYIYASTYYPLLANIADATKAQGVIENLPILEAPGGIMASAYVTGMQWDATFGWAPHQYFTIMALNQYDAIEDAQRLAQKYISMINNDFKRTGKIYEKYDVNKRTSDVVKNIFYGYKVNVEGFGWTNATYLKMLEFL